MVNSTEPIIVAQFQKLANQSMLNCALEIEMVNNFFFFFETMKSFGRLIKRGTF